jgi:hypothetical protein
MPTPVEVTLIKRRADGIVGLGGTWLSAHNIIEEIDQPDGERQWDFFVVFKRANALVVVAPMPGGRELMAAGRPLTHLGLKECEGPIPK